MKDAEIKTAIEQGKTALGVELGSTRIKAVLIGPDHAPIASGAFDWENRLENGIWTYRLEDVWTGVQAAYREMALQVKEKYGTALKRPGAMGFSAMMHGYLAFDGDGEQLAEFRTWRNTVTEAEAAELTELFRFNIPGHPERGGACGAYRLSHNACRVCTLEADGGKGAGRGGGLRYVPH